MTIDLRSDTVTRPTPAMRAAMAAASVGDDVFGDDPSINALEARVAKLAGKEAALLCSSGTQSNLLGLLSLCQRGEEYLVGQEYHTYRYEAGGAAVLGGIVPQPFEVLADGTLDLALVRKRIKPDDPHFPITRVLALENTHQGKVMPEPFIQAAKALVDEHGLKFHLDGARLFNAAVATKRSLADLAAPFDSLSLCCSKGLGAPVGSLLCGSAEQIHKARRWRKMLGGGMRQAGVLAAAIDHALDHHVERLADDHRRAQDLANGLGAIEGIHVESVHTNMVYLNWPSAEQAAMVAQHLKAHNVLVSAAQRMRLVTHLDIDDAAITRTIELVREALA